jgi:hypothetical protein
VAKKKATKKYYDNIGRPKGAKSYQPKGLEVRTATPLSRTNAVDKKKGLKRLVLETRDEDHAKRLQRLATLIRKRDKNLLELIS